MKELIEVTREEREYMMRVGVFDINGNIPAHPGYTGVHQHEDGSYFYRGEKITDDKIIHAIQHRNDPPIQEEMVKKEATEECPLHEMVAIKNWWQFWK